MKFMKRILFITNEPEKIDELRHSVLYSEIHWSPSISYALRSNVFYFDLIIIDYRAYIMRNPGNLNHNQVWVTDEAKPKFPMPDDFKFVYLDSLAAEIMNHVRL